MEATPELHGEQATCRRCKAPMKSGKAMISSLTGTPDFAGDEHAITLSPGGPGKLVPCLKCPDCGHSVHQ
jgi:hypothetical protein